MLLLQIALAKFQNTRAARVSRSRFSHTKRGQRSFCGIKHLRHKLILVKKIGRNEGHHEMQRRRRLPYFLGGDRVIPWGRAQYWNRPLERKR